MKKKMNLSDSDARLFEKLEIEVKAGLGGRRLCKCSAGEPERASFNMCGWLREEGVPHRMDLGSEKQHAGVGCSV